MEDSRSAPRWPYRIWMTGSVAVVMASLVALRAMPEPERARRVTRSSPYSVAETVLRIEEAAARSGLGVLLREDGAETVVVLASSAGGTPVAMATAGGAPDMPLAFQVRAQAGGASVVSTAPTRPELAGALRAVSPAAADELAALPRLIDGALA
jgi:hypothetical protein